MSCHNGHDDHAPGSQSGVTIEHTWKGKVKRIDRECAENSYVWKCQSQCACLCTHSGNKSKTENLSCVGTARLQSVRAMTSKIIGDRELAESMISCNEGWALLPLPQD